MKNVLRRLALWGFAFIASSALADSQGFTVSFNTNDIFVTQNIIYLEKPIAPVDEKTRLWEKVDFYISGPVGNCQRGNYVVTCTHNTTGAVKTYTFSYGYYGGNSTNPETHTCQEAEGGFVGNDLNFPDNNSYCMHTGWSTGGADPQPLLCQTEGYLGTSQGWTHIWTATQCYAETSPDPQPDPDPDPNPDPDPDPEPDPGTPGGTGQPSSGTTGGTTGTSGSDPVNLVMDFKPVTERLDLIRADAVAHTNYLGQRINAASNAEVAATNSLKPLLEAIGVKTDSVATAVREGTAEVKGELNTLNNTGKAIEGAIKDGNTALGEKLDGIKEGIDKLTDGIPIDGEYAANSTQLPDYDTAVRDGIAQIQSTVNQYADESGINDLTNRQAVTGMFEAAQSFSDVFDIARSNCSPIPFGSHGTFNICGAAPTISSALEIIIWALTALFIFHFIAGLLTRERLT